MVQVTVRRCITDLVNQTILHDTFAEMRLSLIDDKLHQNIVKVDVEITSRRGVISTANFDNVMTQFIINKRQTHKN